MSTINLSEVAKFLESGMNLGRRPADCLHLLNEAEITAVINNFLQTNSVQHKIRMSIGVKEGERVNAIKKVREIVSSCGLGEARDFVMGDKELTVTDQQLIAIRRHFSNIIAK
jgi:ribosomal protein L7/L12